MTVVRIDPPPPKYSKSRKYEHGCIICAMHYFIKFGNWNGMFVYRYTCPHMDPTLKKCKMEFIPQTIVHNLIQQAVCFIGIGLEYENVKATFAAHDSTMFLFTWVFIFHYSLVQICLLASVMFHWEPTYFRQFIDLIENGKREYNIEYIFTKKSEDTLRSLFKTTTIIIAICSMFPVVDFLLTTLKYREFDGRHCFRCFMICMVVTKETLREMSLAVMPSIYAYIFRDFNEQIADRLNSVRNSRFQESDVTISGKNGSWLVRQFIFDTCTNWPWKESTFLM